MEHAVGIRTNDKAGSNLEDTLGQTLADISTLAPREALSLGMDYLSSVPQNRALEVAAALCHANPFFLPAVSDGDAQGLKLSTSQLAELTFRARLTANRARQPNVLVACAPKSASTFISMALVQALDIPLANLALPSLTPGSGSALGGNLRSQETDELALMRHGLNGRGYVAQHHIRCTPYLARQMALYNIRPIVTVRNFFDTLISLDDMFQSWRASNRPVDTIFFDDGLPINYHHLPFEERLDMLVAAQAVWYAQFLLSWQRCEMLNLVKPLWVSYETDFLGDKAVLADRIATFTGADSQAAQKITEALADKRDGERKRINQGIAGRGAEVPDNIRRQAMAIFDRYAGYGDLTLLTGPVAAKTAA
ncbi:hypothetical protein G6L63_05030 [Agrobacterium vitis]|uniref:Sulfotransferase n=1 Tax=Agrobacterium vitis TaxID=373 RepID=A0A368NTK9_AGRVI|nr:hypothetical protein [Agrobacterium vitis]KAA3519650.1 hypothetical protein DXM22_01780 [Agrobacterium vitis]KAA3532139.1 hypothetical protein DXT89_01945 [Agrobacterium vitis]MCF1475796.1 hypothetical protein [Agrobacterium vitis]MUZ99986.1 hypothetical protein [Agrobacterium vitis]MVA29435.1 hypothetical protein [Agrobacterium vitis]